MRDVAKGLLVKLLLSKFGWIALAIALLLGIMMLATTFLISMEEEQNQQETQSIGTAQVNEEVEALRPLFEKYAEQYGIPNQVDVLMAKTMQESGGRVDDVMQASESLGLPMNSLDTEASIKQGTKYFAQVLEKADGDVKLALQSYNCATRS